MRRLLDILLALGLLLVVGPVLALLASQRGARARQVRVYGSMGLTLGYPVRRIFGRDSRWRLLNAFGAVPLVLVGQLSMVGPRAVWLGRKRPRYANFGVQPGIVSVHWVRTRMNMAFDSVDDVDRQQIRALSTSAYCSVLLRFVLSLVLGGEARSRRDIPAQATLLDVTIDNMTMAEALESVAELSMVAKSGGRAHQIAFVNADCFNIAFDNPAYRDLLTSVRHVFADGIGARLALGWFCKVPVRDNVNGTDMFPRLCQLSAQRGLTMYLLGAQPGVAQQVADLACSRVPGLQIVGTHHGFLNAENTPAVLADIRALRPNFVLVAMGVPKQERWIADHLDQLQAGVVMGVGGLFDFYSGRIARAPVWLRELGLEWLYRMLQEPQRMWRRYVIGNPRFLWRSWLWARKHRHSDDVAKAKALA